MSTLTGHSDLHALHARQRSSADLTSSLSQPVVIVSPQSTWPAMCVLSPCSSACTAALSGEALEETAASDELTDLVGEDGERDLVAVRLALDERFGEPSRLLGSDLRWHWRRERIHHRLHDHRPRGGQCLIQHGTAILRILDGEPGRAAGTGERREVDGLQFAAVLGI